MCVCAGRDNQHMGSRPAEISYLGPCSLHESVVCWMVNRYSCMYSVVSILVREAQGVPSYNCKILRMHTYKHACTQTYMQTYIHEYIHRYIHTVAIRYHPSTLLTHRCGACTSASVEEEGEVLVSTTRRGAGCCILLRLASRRCRERPVRS